MLMTPRQLQQVDSSTTTTILYHLQWEAPSNIENINLDHYQLFLNDTLVHADQKYALINLQEGVPTIVKVAAANKCGQISNFSTETITPATTNRPQTTVVPTTDDATAAQILMVDNSTSGSQQNMASLYHFTSTVDRNFNVKQTRNWYILTGPYAAFLKGGLHGGMSQIGMMWALAHSSPRGSGGMLPQKILEI